MSQTIKDDQCSDEEVFIGKLSLKEIKKHILWNNHWNVKYTCATSKEDYDQDIKIIETHSTPNLMQNNIVPSIKKSISNLSLSPNGPEAYSAWEVKAVDDSFLKVEKMVTDLCASPKKLVKTEELNNTLDIIDYILNNGAPSDATQNLTVEEVKVIVNEISNDKNLTNNKNKDTIKSEVPTEFLHKDHVISSSSACLTPAKSVLKLHKTETVVTPLANSKQKPPLFKTPANPQSLKKSSASTLKKTPIKSNAYQHIASPVASYIKNCPIAPLVKDVRPTKPLPGTSSIPKFVKTPLLHKSNKENINLPSVAYKSAKKTQVIDIPDSDKLPRTQLMKKITSSLPKPLIMKHNHREVNLARRMWNSQQDSFVDLPLQQADVSVCTQKSAFNKPKKPM